MKREDSNTEKTIRQLYTDLSKLGSNGEWEKAKKVANRSKWIPSFIVQYEYC